MADRSKIEWTDATWNPIRALVGHPDGPKIGWHCEHVSEGCRNCYAEGINRRLGTGRDFKPGDLYREEKRGFHNGEVKLFLDEKMLAKPLTWKKPRMVFVCSMTDLFADFVPDEMIDKVFAVMALCPQHTFQVLTKRSARMRAYLSDPGADRRVHELVCDLTEDPTCRLANVILIAPGVDERAAPPGRRVYLGEWPLKNVWLGVSAERQQEADQRIPDLLATPAAVRFLSAEPLLGPINLTKLSVAHPNGDRLMKIDVLKYPEARLDWVIVGGESGRGARPMHPDWALFLRDQCTAAGVPFFFKQWGEWGVPEPGKDPGGPWHRFGEDGPFLRRFGKKAAGRLLDGREWNEMPGADAPQREAEMAQP